MTDHTSNDNFGEDGGEDNYEFQGPPAENTSKERLRQIHEAMLEELGIGRMDSLPLADKGPRVDNRAPLAKPAAAASNPWNSYVPDDIDPDLGDVDNIADGQLYRLRRGTHNGLVAGFDPNGRGGGGKRGGRGGSTVRGGMQSNRGGHSTGGPSRGNPPPRGMPATRGGRGGGAKRGMGPRNYVPSLTGILDPQDGKHQFMISADARKWGSKHQRIDAIITQLRGMCGNGGDKSSKTPTTHGQINHPKSTLTNAKQRQEQQAKNPWAAGDTTASAAVFMEHMSRTLPARPSSISLNTAPQQAPLQNSQPCISLPPGTQLTRGSQVSGNGTQAGRGLGAYKWAVNGTQPHNSGQNSAQKAVQSSVGPLVNNDASVSPATNQTTTGVGLSGSKWAVKPSGNDQPIAGATSIAMTAPRFDIQPTPQTADPIQSGPPATAIEPGAAQQTSDKNPQVLLKRQQVKLSRADHPGKWKNAEVQVLKEILRGDTSTVWLVCTVNGDQNPTILSKITETTTLFANDVVITFCDGAEDLYIWSLHFAFPHAAKIFESTALAGGRNLLPRAPSTTKSEPAEFDNQSRILTDEALTVVDDAQQEQGLLIDFANDQDDISVPPNPWVRERPALTDLCILTDGNIDSVFEVISKVAGGNLIATLLENVHGNDLGEESSFDDFMNSVEFIDELDTVTNSFFSTSEIFTYLTEDEQNMYLADICPKILNAAIRIRDHAKQANGGPEESSAALVQEATAHGPIYTIGELMSMKSDSTTVAGPLLYMPTADAAQTTQSRNQQSRRKSILQGRQTYAQGEASSGTHSRGNSELITSFEQLGAQHAETSRDTSKHEAVTAPENLALHQSAIFSAVEAVQTVVHNMTSKSAVSPSLIGDVGHHSISNETPTLIGQANPIFNTLMTEVHQSEPLVTKEISIKSEQHNCTEHITKPASVIKHRPSPSMDILATQFGGLKVTPEDQAVGKPGNHHKLDSDFAQALGVNSLEHSQVEDVNSARQPTDQNKNSAYSAPCSSAKVIQKSEEERSNKLRDLYSSSISRRPTPASRSPVLSSMVTDNGASTAIAKSEAEPDNRERITSAVPVKDKLSSSLPKMGGGLNASKWASPQATGAPTLPAHVPRSSVTCVPRQPPEVASFSPYTPQSMASFAPAQDAPQILGPLAPIRVQAAGLPMRTVYVHDFHGSLVPVRGLSLDDVLPSILPLSPLLPFKGVPAQSNANRHHSSSAGSSTPFQPNAATFSPRGSQSGTPHHPASPNLKENIKPGYIQERLTRSLKEREGTSDASFLRN